MGAPTARKSRDGARLCLHAREDEEPQTKQARAGDGAGEPTGARVSKVSGKPPPDSGPLGSVFNQGVLRPAGVKIVIPAGGGKAYAVKIK